MKPQGSEGIPTFVAAIWPGKSAVLWPECRRDSVIRLGWDWFRSDLSRFDDYEDFLRAYDEAFRLRNNPKDSRDIPLNLWQFCHLNPGDIVLALGKRTRILALGRVTGPYTFLPNLEMYRHAVSIAWGPQIDFDLPAGLSQFPRKTFTPVPHERFEQVFNLPVKDYWRLTGDEKPVDQAFQAIRSRIDAEPNIDLSALKNEEERRWAALCIRQGQSAFRDKLIKHYSGICPITGCDAEAALEAAHIVPYSKGGSDGNVASNGLLLRSDIHALFDSRLLFIEPATLTVRLDVALRTTVYKSLEGLRLQLPPTVSQTALTKALKEREKRERPGT